MLVMFFGTVEFSSGVAVDRKVTLMARTLSDLTSQATSVADTDLTNFFTASIGDHDAVFVDADQGHDLGDLRRFRPDRAGPMEQGATMRAAPRRRRWNRTRRRSPTGARRSAAPI